MSDPRRHHHIPRYLLREWTGGDEQIEVVRRKGGEKLRFFRTSIMNVFQERDLYALENEDGTLDQRIEKDRYQQIDNLGSDLHRQVLAAVRQGKLPLLVGQARTAFVEVFIRTMVVRSPGTFDGPVARFDMEAAKKRALATVVQNGADEAEQQALLSDPEATRRVERNAVAYARARPSLETAEQLAALGLNFARVDDANCSFVVSDMLLDGAGLMDSEDLGAHRLWVPLAPDIAFRLEGDANRLSALNRPQVRSINERLYRQSATVASNSRTLLSSLARSCDRVRWRTRAR